MVGGIALSLLERAALEFFHRTVVAGREPESAAPVAAALEHIKVVEFDGDRNLV